MTCYVALNFGRYEDQDARSTIFFYEEPFQTPEAALENLVESLKGVYEMNLASMSPTCPHCGEPRKNSTWCLVPEEFSEWVRSLTQSKYHSGDLVDLDEKGWVPEGVTPEFMASANPLTVFDAGKAIVDYLKYGSKSWSIRYRMNSTYVLENSEG